VTATPTNTLTSTPTGTATTVTRTPTNTPTATPTTPPAATGQVVPNGTTCAQYAAGTALDLNEVLYTLRRGKIDGTAPGNFLYYSRVTATSANFTLSVVQTRPVPAGSNHNQIPLFNVPRGQVNLYQANCAASGLNTFVVVDDGQALIMVRGATPGRQYIVSTKYTTSTVEGAPAPNPPTVHYDFSTYRNTTRVDQDFNGVDLKKQ
jgi:hypothetical protein